MPKYRTEQLFTQEKGCGPGDKGTQNRGGSSFWLPPSLRQGLSSQHPTPASTVAVAGPALPGTVSCCKAGGHQGRTTRPVDPGTWVDEGDVEAAR